MTFSRQQIVKAHEAATASDKPELLQRVTHILADMLVSGTESVDKNALGEGDCEVIQELLEPAKS